MKRIVKKSRGWLLLMLVLVLSGVGVYLYLWSHQKMDFSFLKNIGRVSVDSFVFHKRVIDIDDPKKIGEICGFVRSRAKDWGPDFNTRSVNSIQVTFYDSKDIVLGVNVGRNGMIIATENGQFVKRIDDHEFESLLKLLGTNSAACGLFGSK
jgi:hypothetical protein